MKQNLPSECVVQHCCLPEKAEGSWSRAAALAGLEASKGSFGILVRMPALPSAFPGPCLSRCEMSTVIRGGEVQGAGKREQTSANRGSCWKVSVFKSIWPMSFSPFPGTEGDSIAVMCLICLTGLL